MKKTTIKKIIDVIMILMFIFELLHLLINGNIHEIVGLLLIVLIVIHNIINIHWYINIFKGKYNKRRFISLVIIVLLIIDFIVIGLSGISMSNIFTNIRIFSNDSVKNIHYYGTIIALVLVMIHIILHGSRYVKKYKKTFYLTSIVITILVGAITMMLPYYQRWYVNVNINNINEIVKGDKVKLDQKVLTVYFGRVGNTDFDSDVDTVSGASLMNYNGELYGNSQVLAMMVNDVVGGDLLALQTEKKYSKDYATVTSEARDEIDNKDYPTLLNDLSNVDDYDVIFVVYPLWWGTIPNAIGSFLQETNLENKIIVPVASQGSSGFGNSIKDIKELTKAKVIDQGISIYSLDIISSRKDIYNWINDIKSDIN